MKARKAKPKLRIKTDLDDEKVFPVAHRGYIRSPTGGFLTNTLLLTPWAGDKPNSGLPPHEISRRGYSRSPTGGFFRDTADDGRQVSEYHAKYWKHYEEELQRQASTPRSPAVAQGSEGGERTSRPLTPHQRYIAYSGYSRTPYGGFFPLRTVSPAAT